MKYPQACVALFAKAPVPGRVKTRLIPALGIEGACQLHAALLAHAVALLGQFVSSRVELWVDAQPEHPAFAPLRDVVRIQAEGNLGNRMNHATQHILQRFSEVILIGADCPALDADYLDLALATLQGAVDGVLGPARDGGYVLIGLKSPHPALFERIDWGSAKVLQQTLARAQESNLSLKLLPELADIDRPEDLHLLPPGLLPGFRHGSA